jgi:hypothetical protein
LDKQELLKRAETNTYFNAKSIQHLRQKIADFDSDYKIYERKSKQLCKHCFYVNTGRFAGQAFTNRNCGACEKTMTFSTTDTDKFCQECAKELSICKHCGAMMD